MDDSLTAKPPTEGRLKQGASLFDIVSIGVGAAVGVSVFSVLAPAAEIAGPGLLVAIMIAAVPMIVFVLNYAFMGSAVPTSGASYVWPARFLHPYFGFIVGWLRILGSVGAMIVLAQVLVQYISSVLAVPLKLGMLVLIALVFVVNLVGVKATAKFQTLMVAILLCALGAYIVIGLPSVDTANLQPVAPNGWLAIFSAVALLATLYLGIESATEVGEEIRDVRRTITRGLGISVTIAIVLYGLVALVTLGVMSAPTLAASDAPLFDTAELTLGGAAGAVMLSAAIVAIGTGLNGVFLIFTRYLYAMARDGVLPAPMARVSQRFGTPHIAIVVAFVLCLIGLFLPSSLLFLFLAVNIPTMLKYLSCSLSASRLPARWPELYERAAFKFGPTSTVVLGYAGALCAAAILVLGFSADWRPYALLAGWAVVGSVYWLVLRANGSRNGLDSLRAERV